jgi:BirA family biotin operon repressor/biotin-[acetyl-CoA-carboxylase] ligase
MDSPVLEKDICTRGLTTRIIGKIINFHDVVISTNDIAKELAEGGAREGTVVVARKQTGGKGRLNRTFSSPDGGIYLSIILRPGLPPEEMASLPLIAGLSVSKAIQCTIFKEILLKWPNDVMKDGRKIAGILTTSSIKGRDIEYVIVGIGINLNTRIEDLPDDIRSIAGSVKDADGEDIDPNEFLRDLLYFLDLQYSQFISGDRESLLDQWSSRSETIGREVTVKTDSGEISGKALGLDQSGALIIRSKKGMERVDSGDCVNLS